MGYFKQVEIAASKRPGLPVPNRKYVYHVTRKALVSSIIKSGLTPMNDDLWKTRHSTKEAKTKEPKVFFIPDFNLDSISMAAEDTNEFLKDSKDALYLLRIEFNKIKDPLWGSDEEEQEVEMWSYSPVPISAITYLENIDEVLDGKPPIWKSFDGKNIKSEIKPKEKPILNPTSTSVNLKDYDWYINSSKKLQGFMSGKTFVAIKPGDVYGVSKDKSSVVVANYSLNESLKPTKREINHLLKIGVLTKAPKL